MLIRAYRFTDKASLMILKSSVALSTLALDGINLIVGSPRPQGGGVLGLLFGFAALVLALLRRLGIIVGLLLARLMWIVRVIARRIWQLLSLVFGRLMLLFGNRGGRTIRGARASATGSASDMMARRAARAEMEAGLAEDPLRVHNRILSLVVVAMMIVVLGLLLLLRPQDTTPIVAPPGSNLDGVALLSTPEPTSPGVFSTAIPTATEIPDILQIRGTLAYVVREKGQQDIWAVGIGTNTAPIRLTNDPADDRDPAWSPDGQRLAYASRRDGNWDIYVYDLRTNNTTRLTFDLSFQGGPQWSPDGEWLVYESYQGNNLDIYITPVDGSEPPLRLPGSSDAPDFSPAWSPADGRNIAFVSAQGGNQDIYVFNLDQMQAINVTNTPERNEDHPSWNRDGDLLAFSAIDGGIEKIFVQPANSPGGSARPVSSGRAPSWSPDGVSLVFAVDSLDETHLYARPFEQIGLPAEILPVPLGASDTTWTEATLPPALVNAGGLPSPILDELFIEQEVQDTSDPPYRLNSLINVDAPNPILSDRVNDSFNALREKTLEVAGWDFLGRLDDAWWDINRPPQPGEERRNWHMAGRAFAITRSSILGFPPPVEIVREDLGVETYWRVYVRVDDQAQGGQLGEPLRHIPWDFTSRNQGDVQAYNEGGRNRTDVPEGYYIDFTLLANDYGWERIPAGSDWRANINSVNYWDYRKSDDLTWYDAMREIWTEGQMGGFNPTATPTPP